MRFIHWLNHHDFINWLIIIGGYILWVLRSEIARSFRGWRDVYSLDGGKVKHVIKPLRMQPAEHDWYDALVVKHWLFWKWTTIYGEAGRYWELSFWRGEDNRVRLNDRNRYKIETALQLLSSRTVQDMNEEIKRLSMNLDKTQLNEERWRSALYALLKKIDSERHQFRSQAAKRIREDLLVILETAEPADHIKVIDWVVALRTRERKRKPELPV